MTLNTPPYWALILAAGAGTRLRSLTSEGDGRFVPKQFCSLNGGPSLLEETILRARGITSAERTLLVVAAEHRAHWQLSRIRPDNVIVQPANRGTANGMLLGAASILQRDSNAILTVLPSDHYVAQEPVLKRALAGALAEVQTDAASDAIYFLGIEPDEPDTELGYILCSGPQMGTSYRIARFIEKPSRELAAALLQQRALWNSFILVARARALVALIERRFPTIVAAFRNALRAESRESEAQTLRALYEHLPTIDFSRAVVEGTDAALRVVPVPQCGWSDLGTPERVARCLQSLARDEGPQESSHLSLAEACMRQLGTSIASVAASS